MKPLYAFGMAGFLLASAVAAQAHAPFCPTPIPGPSLCTLCQVDEHQVGKPNAVVCGGKWTDFQGLFHQGGGKVMIHPPGCADKLTLINTMGTFIALCCVPNNFAHCPEPRP